MSIATTHIDVDPQVRSRARRYGVTDHLGGPDHDTVIAWLHAVTANDTRYVAVGTHVAPYNGNPTPVWMDGSTPAVKPQQPPVAPSKPTVRHLSTPTVEGDQEPAENAVPRAFEDGFELVEWRDLRGRRVPHAIAVCRLIRLDNINRGDICETVTHLEQMFGVNRETIRTWLKPGGPLSDRYTLRDYPNGGHIAYSAEGHLMWRIKAIPAAEPAEDDAAALYQVKVPHQWLYAHPDHAEGSEWVGAWKVATPVVKDGKERIVVTWVSAAFTTGPNVQGETVYDDGAIYAAMCVRALTFGKRSARLSVPGIARAFKAVQPRRMDTLLAQAEAVGLVTTEGSRSGRVAAIRRWHNAPVPVSARTTATRVRAYKGHQPTEDAPVVEESTEAPF